MAGEKCADKFRVAQNPLSFIFSVGVVPVVGSEDRAVVETGFRAKDATKFRDGFNGQFPACALARDDGGRVQFALTERNAHAAVRHIEPERDAFAIHLPEAEGTCSGFYAIAMGAVARLRGEVPGQGALRNERSPVEVAITALPRIAENEHGCINGDIPAEMNTDERKCGRGDVDIQLVVSGDSADFDSGCLPCGLRALQRDRMHVLSECSCAVGHAQNFAKAGSVVSGCGWSLAVRFSGSGSDRGGSGSTYKRPSCKACQQTTSQFLLSELWRILPDWKRGRSMDEQRVDRL